MFLFDNPESKKAEANRKNHDGVTFDEAKTVFDDARNVTVSDFESDPGEERLVTVRMSYRARVLVVVYTYRGELIRLISTRKATLGERKGYNDET